MELGLKDKCIHKYIQSYTHIYTYTHRETIFVIWDSLRELGGGKKEKRMIVNTVKIASM
jgi:hypothetical protein